MYITGRDLANPAREGRIEVRAIQKLTCATDARRRL